MLVPQPGGNGRFVFAFTELLAGFHSHPTFVRTVSNNVSFSQIQSPFFLFSGNLEVTVDFLTGIDQLVQLIESPIFACEYPIVNFFPLILPVVFLTYFGFLQISELSF